MLSTGPSGPNAVGAGPRPAPTTWAECSSSDLRLVLRGIVGVLGEIADELGVLRRPLREGLDHVEGLGGVALDDVDVHRRVVGLAVDRVEAAAALELDAVERRDDGFGLGAARPLQRLRPQADAAIAVFAVLADILGIADVLLELGDEALGRVGRQRIDERGGDDDAVALLRAELGLLAAD